MCLTTATMTGDGTINGSYSVTTSLDLVKRSPILQDSQRSKKGDHGTVSLAPGNGTQPKCCSSSMSFAVVKLSSGLPSRLFDRNVLQGGSLFREDMEITYLNVLNKLVNFHNKVLNELIFFLTKLFNKFLDKLIILLNELVICFNKLIILNKLAIYFIKLVNVLAQLHYGLNGRNRSNPEQAEGKNRIDPLPLSICAPSDEEERSIGERRHGLQMIVTSLSPSPNASLTGANGNNGHGDDEKEQGEGDSSGRGSGGGLKPRGFGKLRRGGREGDDDVSKNNDRRRHKPRGKELLFDTAKTDRNKHDKSGGVSKSVGARELQKEQQPPLQLQVNFFPPKKKVPPDQIPTCSCPPRTFLATVEAPVQLGISLQSADHQCPLPDTEPHGYRSEVVVGRDSHMSVQLDELRLVSCMAELMGCSPLEVQLYIPGIHHGLFSGSELSSLAIASNVYVQTNQPHRMLDVMVTLIHWKQIMDQHGLRLGFLTKWDFLYGVWVGASGGLVINLSLCGEQSLDDLVVVEADVMSTFISLWEMVHGTRVPEAIDRMNSFVRATTSCAYCGNPIDLLYNMY